MPNALLHIETMAASREARLNGREAFDFIFADKDSDEKGIIDEEEEFESSSESEFEDKLNDVNGKPEISGPLTAPRARGRVRAGGFYPAPYFMLYHTATDYSQKQNTYFSDITKKKRQFYCICHSAKHYLVAVRTSFNFLNRFSRIAS